MPGKALVVAVAGGPAFAVVLVGAGLTAVGGAGTGTAGPTAAGSAAGDVRPLYGGTGDIPPDMLELYREAAGTCPGLPWVVLAGIGRVETDHGRNTAVSSAGARGPMQFLPATWAEYGVDVHGSGRPDIDDPADAVFGAARMLCADGGARPAGAPGALFAYNHSTTYVSDVLGWAATYAVVYGGPDGPTSASAPVAAP